MDQSRKVAKFARGQLNRETKHPCRCIRGKYVHGHTYSKSMDQPGKVDNPARGQLNREK